MTLISIRETAGFDASPNATVSFDNRGAFPVTAADPFSEEDEKRLEWYFEEFLRFPFVNEVRAKEAAESIPVYGEMLFEQVFKKDFDLFGEYRRARERGPDTLRFEIVGSPDFHRLHWEALKDQPPPGHRPARRRERRRIPDHFPPPLPKSWESHRRKRRSC